MKDPMESIVASAFDRAGIAYERNKELEPGRYSIDFYLPHYDLWVEVCQFHTPRKIEQLARLPNVVLIQGIEAAKNFARLLEEAAACVEAFLVQDTQTKDTNGVG